MTEADKKNVNILSVAISKWLDKTYKIDIRGEDYEELKETIRNTYVYKQKPKLHEIRIKRTSTLGYCEKAFVLSKLAKKSKNYNYQKYCKISYFVDGTIDFEPIEGNIIDEYNRILNHIAEEQ